MYSQIENLNEYPIQFINAFDELNNRKRNLFNLSYIDQFLDFNDKKNICIVNRISQSNFLYHLITNLCIYSFENKEKYKTIIVDSGKGSNLGYLYLEIINRRSNTLYNIDEILKNITIVRTFTFYQLANIVIKAIPKFINQNLNCKIQIIILDLLDTFPSSLSLSTLSNKNKIDNNINLNYNLRILEQIIDKLNQISSTYFVILSYNSFNTLLDNIIIPKFSNRLEIGLVNNNIAKKITEDNNIIINIHSKSNRIKSFMLSEKTKKD
ncbi:MAG TPA: hypothetical protein VN704_02195 [Verrucomicrobiae bacterium]|nr:hypothetical protein [Verrucomicrobiae bacterium]